MGSVPVSVIAVGVSFAVVTDWALAVGWPTTVIETVAGVLVSDAVAVGELEAVGAEVAGSRACR